ncbi:hypothetical protein BZG36_02419 [Bifiguratus adelaidae]|uniref:Ubiquitin-related modifier 1 n=1 Tax=Bifiguratus adelaidae TaxID=1938954 RepID=A0A261Y1A0_9FUNG|nr:hypothetical protein BZG36_02419 [Bifiguratus adelaidae]
MATLHIDVEFGGGMELLFKNVREHKIDMPEGSNLKDLITYIRDNLMTAKQDLFVMNDTVRPGILVLINEADWELCDGIEYKLEDGDRIIFISTLHGG